MSDNSTEFSPHIRISKNPCHHSNEFSITEGEDGKIESVDVRNALGEETQKYLMEDFIPTVNAMEGDYATRAVVLTLSILIQQKDDSIEKALSQKKSFIQKFVKQCEVNDKLKEENDKLKEELEKVKSLKQSEINEVVKSDEGTMKLYGDIAKLMSENEKLKEVISHNEFTEDVENFCESNPTMEQLKEDNKKLRGFRHQLRVENGELREENKELKEEAEENKKLYDTTFSEFMKLNKQIKKLKDFQILKNKEVVELTNALQLSDTFLEQYITNELEKEEVGQITIPNNYFSDFLKPHFNKHIDTILEKMTTYSSNGYGCYENGYWYNHELMPAVLQHDGNGTICITYKYSDSDSDDGVDVD